MAGFGMKRIEMEHARRRTTARTVFALAIAAGIASTPVLAQSNSTLGNAAGGAARGAVIGAIAGDAGKGAAAGAVGGLLFGGARRNR